MAFEAVLFDLDGTLLDTEEGILKSVEYVVQEKGGTPLGQDLLRTFIGPPIQQSFARTFNLDEGDANVWAARFREVYRTEYLLYAKPYEGIFEVLDCLVEAGIMVGVATYKREDYAYRLLESFGFTSYTPHIFGSDMQGKMTKADIIEKTVASLGVLKEACLMVGDTVHDAQGAYTSGMPFLGVTYGYGFSSENEDISYPCVGFVNSPQDIWGYCRHSLQTRKDQKEV